MRTFIGSLCRILTQAQTEIKDVLAQGNLAASAGSKAVQGPPACIHLTGAQGRGGSGSLYPSLYQPLKVVLPVTVPPPLSLKRQSVIAPADSVGKDAA